MPGRLREPRRLVPCGFLRGNTPGQGKKEPSQREFGKSLDFLPWILQRLVLLIVPPYLLLLSVLPSNGLRKRGPREVPNVGYRQSIYDRVLASDQERHGPWVGAPQEREIKDEIITGTCVAASSSYQSKSQSTNYSRSWRVAATYIALCKCFIHLPHSHAEHERGGLLSPTSLIPADCISPQSICYTPRSEAKR